MANSNSTNQTPSTETQSKLNNGPTYDGVDLGKNYWTEGPIPEFSQIMGGFNITAYKFSDGSQGWALYNGKTAFHIDNNNNITFSAGEPSQSGCGGKVVINSKSQLQKAESIAIEVTGRDDGGTIDKTTDEDGNVEEKNLPSYSLKVYGPVKIEAVGGDCSVKGDNVTVNAGSVLALKSNKDIILQAGEKGGKISMFAGAIEMDASFFNKKITGGDYTEGAGEVKVTQNKAGSSVTYETPGSVLYVVNGDYSVNVKGTYKTDVKDNYIINVDKDWGAKVLGDYANVIEGKALLKVNGVGSKSKQTQNLLIDVLANEKKSQPGFEIDSSSLIKFTNKEGGFEWEVGKNLATMKLTDKNEFSVTTGPQLGAITLDKKQATIEHGKTSKLSIKQDGTSMEFNKVAKLSLNSTESKMSYGDGSYVSVKPSDVTVFGPMVYLN
jgi:hypothetical protein